MFFPLILIKSPLLFSDAVTEILKSPIDFDELIRVVQEVNKLIIRIRPTMFFILLLLKISLAGKAEGAEYT